MGGKPRRRRRRNISYEVMGRIEDLASRGRSGAEIRRVLELEYESDQNVIPATRTIQDIIRRLQPRDPSGPWSLAGADGDDAALVLPVLAALVEATAGEKSEVTERQASWIVKLRTAVPDLPAWETFRLARAYMVFEDNKEPCTPLDLFLAYAPWRSEAADERYYEALSAGRVPWIAALPLGIPMPPRVANRRRSQPGITIVEEWQAIADEEGHDDE